MLSFFSLFSSAQEKDFELWTSIGISKKINKKISLGLKEDVRFYDNARRLSTNFTQVSGSYKINSWLTFKLAYRFANSRTYMQTTEHDHVFLGDLKLKQDFRRFEFSYRLRYQSKYSNIYTQENGLDPSSYLRHKWLIDYKIRGTRFTPSLAFELYQDMDYEDRYFQKKQRYTIACDYEFKNKNEATFFFTLQREVNQVNPVQSGILGLKYNFSL